MKISWFKAIKAAPAAKKAIDALVVPGASESASVWYNLTKASVTMASACGIYLYLTEEEIQTISSVLALAVPAVLTLFDMLANIWLRVRSPQSRQQLVARKTK